VEVTVSGAVHRVLDEDYFNTLEIISYPVRMGYSVKAGKPSRLAHSTTPALSTQTRLEVYVDPSPNFT